MNNIWSENIQGTMMLYLSRKLRFDDIFFGQYEPLLSLDKSRSLKILEIGCGPGALAEALHRWYPNAEITGLDRDGRFIEYAKNNVPGVTFLEGDATALPFGEDVFDVTISHTVCEHIEPTVFYSEQKRVLKEGGICLVLSARKGFCRLADCLKETQTEKEFWQGIDGEKILERYGVGKYRMTEQELPAVMQKNGFTDISTGYAVIDLTPDDPKYTAQMAQDIINAERASELEAAQLTKSSRMDAVIDIIRRMYDSRIDLYRRGEKQWDTCVSIIMVVRGVNG